MHQFLEAATIALQAIWANKLRSFLTVLGNIVAVTSIIAVVSLVQGLNASVKDAIQSQVGADAFTCSARARRSPKRSSSACAEQPARHAGRRRGDPPVQPERVGLGDGAKPTAAPRPSTRSESLDSVSIQRRDEGIRQPADDEHRARAAHHAERSSTAAATVTILGWDTADRLFGAVDPLDKTISIGGRALPRGRRQREEGVGLRPVAGRIRRDSARGVSAHVRLPAVAAADGAAARPRARPGGDGRHDGGAAHRSAGCGRSSRTTSASSRRTRSSASTTRRPTASSRCSSASSACRSSSAASSS